MEEIPIDYSLPEDLRETYVQASFAAEYKGVHIETIKRHIHRGRLRGVMVGRDWLVYRDSLIGWKPDPGGPRKD